MPRVWASWTAVFGALMEYMGTALTPPPPLAEQNHHQYYSPAETQQPQQAPLLSTCILKRCGLDKDKINHTTFKNTLSNFYADLMFTNGDETLLGLVTAHLCASR